MDIYYFQKQENGEGAVNTFASATPLPPALRDAQSRFGSPGIYYRGCTVIGLAAAMQQGKTINSTMLVAMSMSIRGRIPMDDLPWGEISGNACSRPAGRQDPCNENWCRLSIGIPGYIDVAFRRVSGHSSSSFFKHTVRSHSGLCTSILLLQKSRKSCTR